MIRDWKELVSEKSTIIETILNVNIKSILSFFWHWHETHNYFDIDTRPIITFDRKNKGVEKTRHIKIRTNNIF